MFTIIIIIIIIVIIIIIIVIIIIIIIIRHHAPPGAEPGPTAAEPQRDVEETGARAMWMSPETPKGSRTGARLETPAQEAAAPTPPAQQPPPDRRRSKSESPEGGGAAERGLLASPCSLGEESSPDLNQEQSERKISHENSLVPNQEPPPHADNPPHADLLTQQGAAQC